MSPHRYVEGLESRFLLASGAQLAVRYEDGLAIATMDRAGRAVDVLAGRWVAQFDGYAGSPTAQRARADAAVSAVAPGLRVRQHLGADGLFLVESPLRMTAGRVDRLLAGVPGFRYVEPDLLGEYTLTTPNDPLFGDEWGLNNTGQAGGVPDVDIDAPEAWDVTTGSSSVVVGVLDSGIDYTHPDLAGNIWTNPLETPGNGVDDDGNGFVDDWRGWDFGSNDNDPMGDGSHGTFVSGIIGAEGNNGVGVSGAAWDVSLMALKMTPRVSSATAVSALNYVLALRTRPADPVNIRVVCHTWVVLGYSEALNQVLAAHAAAGILNICGAGNSGANIDLEPAYPASYDQPNIVAVANHTRFDLPNVMASYGPNTVDLFAPGTDILSTARVVDGSYDTGTGASAATPFVAGVAALLWSARPDATWQQVKEALVAGAQPVPAMAGLCVSGGRLNAAASLQRLVTAPARPELAAGSDSGAFDDDGITNVIQPTFAGVVPAAAVAPGGTVLLFADGVEIGSGVVAPDGTWSATSAARLTDGTHAITARYRDAGGVLSVESTPRVVTIDTAPPVLLNPAFEDDRSPHFLRVDFSEDVGHSLADADFLVATSAGAPPVVLPVTHGYDAAQRRARLDFAGAPQVPDGRYRLTVPSSGPGGGVSDLAGNLADAFTFDFAFFRGDANRDGTVNIGDFAILAANFNGPGTFSQGDFNYSGIVEIGDFAILASRFNTGLPAAAEGVPGANARGAARSPGGASPARREDWLERILESSSALV